MRAFVTFIDRVGFVVRHRREALDRFGPRIQSVSTIRRRALSHGAAGTAASNPPTTKTTLPTKISTATSPSLSPPLNLSTASSFLPLGRHFDRLAPECNISANIQTFLGRNLHQQPLHPLHTIHCMICEYWNNNSNNNDDRSQPQQPFAVFDNLSPIVSTTNCFDMLRIPPDHVSRKPTDTYYLNPHTVLRPHTSAHQVELLQLQLQQNDTDEIIQDGENDHTTSTNSISNSSTASIATKSLLNRFLVTGDVYRRDEIDRSHYPVFHQMEGVKMFTKQELQGLTTKEAQVAFIEQDLKQGLEGLATHLFGSVPMRWVDEYFPFTHPSFELEIFYDNEWMEVLGCGVIHADIVKNAGREGEQGWAFGLGLERLAMVLFQIPDIRLFWTHDERFHKQFASGTVVTFKPYSKFPACFKDISFWLSDNCLFHVNDLNEVVRDVAGDLVEQLTLVDQFTHPKTQRTSHCYRITYRSMDRSLTNPEIDALQDQVRAQTIERLGVELR